MTVQQIAKGLWQLNEANENGPYVDCYLIVGERAALLVDSLMNETELYDAVTEITSLPITVVVTHGHLDHAGKGLAQFHRRGVAIHMAKEDLAMLREGVRREWFSPLQEEYDLGGVHIETLPIYGHTPGSIALYDRDRKWLFSGDAIGSGHFWMQLPHSLPLSAFLDNLNRLIERIGDLDDLLVYPGHRSQSPVQLDGQYIMDVRDITQRILDGRAEGKEGVMSLGGRAIRYREAEHGMMRSYCYDPQNLR